MFSSAVNSGNSWWNWKTKPICLLRKSLNFFVDKVLTSTPSIVIEPLFGLSNVPIICNSVVLPAPDGPTILTISPFLICKSMPFKTCRLPKLFVMPLISIIIFINLSFIIRMIVKYIFSINSFPISSNRIHFI